MEFLHGAVEGAFFSSWRAEEHWNSKILASRFGGSFEAAFFFQLSQILFLWRSARPTLGVLVAC